MIVETSEKPEKLFALLHSLLFQLSLLKKANPDSDRLMAKIENCVREIEESIHRKAFLSRATYLMRSDSIFMSQRSYSDYLYLAELLLNLASKNDGFQFETSKYLIVVKLELYKVFLISKTVRRIKNENEKEKIISFFTRNIRILRKKTKFACGTLKAVLGSITYREIFVCENSRLVNLVKLYFPSYSQIYRKRYLMTLHSTFYGNVKPNKYGFMGILRLEIIRKEPASEKV